MNAHKLIAIALAALLVFAGGAAALPGDAPDNPGSDAADDHAPEDPGADADDDEDVNETETNETDDARDENASEGPPTDMPEPVPDHVSEIHQLIRDKLSGDLGNTTLGEAISGVVGGDDAAENADAQSEDADDESANADEQSTQSATASASVMGDLPQQAADHVGAIHDAISSFLNGDGDSPGDAVSTAAQG